MAKKREIKNEQFRRFMAALAILCFCITVVASVLAGSRVFIVTWRGTQVIIILIAVGLIIRKSWESWEGTRSGENKKRRR